jgi:hypothetical protein
VPPVTARPLGPGEDQRVVQHSGAIVQRVDDLHVFRRVKSNTFRFSATRSGLDDRETTTLFNSRFQRTSTWAGVRPYSAAMT